MITTKSTLSEVLDKYPKLKGVFENNGFKGLDNKLILKQIGALPLDSLLRNKQINVGLFIGMLNEHLKEDMIDITLMDNQHKEDAINIIGLLPCPVRIPLLDRFTTLSNLDKINHNLKAASEGLNWLKEKVKKAETEDDLADIYISAGFDLFFEQDLMKKFKDDKVFEDYYKDAPYNSDFENDYLQLRDPSGDYSMLGVVPAVFLVNTSVLGDRPMPKTWKDLLDPMFENSISLPVSDFDLFNAILIHLHKEFGMEAIAKLGKSMIKSMHPAQMVKSDKRSRVRPAISIMPYFFTRMALPGSVMNAVWPEDGAIISPIFMATKRSKKTELQEIADMFTSVETGEILSHKGLFPSINHDVDNKLSGKTFKWVGWDYINNNDLGKIIEETMKVFE
ncbi:MAG: ABC transporter substrate-binding protein, partial [Candidatus Izimaplasma sp.]|nr:ABC transporter substrate-binding protein [Candidatus Izimaplasma bacterium]